MAIFWVSLVYKAQNKFVFLLPTKVLQQINRLTTTIMTTRHLSNIYYKLLGAFRGTSLLLKNLLLLLPYKRSNFSDSVLQNQNKNRKAKKYEYICTYIKKIISFLDNISQNQSILIQSSSLYAFSHVMHFSSFAQSCTSPSQIFSVMCGSS